MMKLGFALLALLACACSHAASRPTASPDAASTSSRAAAPDAAASSSSVRPLARTLLVEITDTPPSGAPKTATVPISLVENRGTSATELKSGDEQITIEAHADGVDTGSFLWVKVHRWRTNRDHKESSEMKFTSGALWHRGERTVLGRHVSTDGVASEIAFTMQ